jgi:hypothetical protein
VTAGLAGRLPVAVERWSKAAGEVAKLTLRFEHEARLFEAISPTEFVEELGEGSYVCHAASVGKCRALQSVFSHDGALP